jgi:hypothetical protein
VDTVVHPAVNPNAILTGGPLADLPEAERLYFVADEAESVKLSRGDRYEHYHRSGRTVRHELGELHLFVWACRTFVAE